MFYTLGGIEQSIYDHGFGINRKWDIDLLKGYNYHLLENISTKPASDHFSGVDNPTLIMEVSSYDPDAILVYGWKFKSHLKILRYFKGKIPLLFRGDSTLLDHSDKWSISKFIKLVLLRWVYGHIDYVLSPGKASDEYFKSSGIKVQQLLRAPHAVDNDRFSGKSTQDKLVNDLDLQEENLIEKAITWRKDLGIPDSYKVFLFAGKFESKKDPLILLQAFKALKRQHDNIHLILVGSGKLMELIESEISDDYDDLKLQNRSDISLLPFQNQSIMPIVYRMCDVYVLPSKGPGETWGLSVNEAMACGKPVIVSNKCGCAQELVQDGINGYTFKSGDLYDLINKMQMFLTKGNLEEMGQASRQIIISFNYESFVIALDECFRKLKL